MKKEKEELKGSPETSGEATTNSVSNASSNEMALEPEKKPAKNGFGKKTLNFFRELVKNEMFRYIIKRLLLLVFTFVIIFLICFVDGKCYILPPNCYM